MKSIGIVRKVVDRKRIVLPVELREMLNIADGDHLEYYLDEEMGTIFLKKYQSGCIFCGYITDDAIYFKGKTICPRCLEEFRHQV